MAKDFIITDKYLDAMSIGLRDNTYLFVFEGTVRSQKTVTATQLLFEAIQDSDEELHLISAENLDSIRDNVLKADFGLEKCYPQYVKRKKEEFGGYYLEVKCDIPNKPKIKRVLLCGYATANQWEKINGKTLGVIMVDEVNNANKQFIDECFMRQSSAMYPKTFWTLNGDIPTHWIYTDYINRARIIGDVPASIRADMDKADKEKGWYYMHWTMRDNPVMTEEKIERSSSIYPIGSYYHTIKILGERGAPGLLLFNDYMSPDKHIKPIDTRKYVEYGIGADIGGNKASNSFSLVGFNHNYSKCGVVDKKTFQQCGYNQKTEELITFIKSHYDKPIRYVAIDSAESNFIKDIRTLFKSIFPHIAVIESYKATIKQRCDLMIILLSHEQIEFNSTKEGIDTYDAYRIAKKSEKPNEYREDKNERHNDIMDSTEYALTRHMNALLKASKNYERFREVA